MVITPNRAKGRSELHARLANSRAKEQNNYDDVEPSRNPVSKLRIRFHLGPYIVFNVFKNLSGAFVRFDQVYGARSSKPFVRQAGPSHDLPLFAEYWASHFKHLMNMLRTRIP